MCEIHEFNIIVFSFTWLLTCILVLAHISIYVSQRQIFDKSQGVKTN